MRLLTLTKSTGGLASYVRRLTPLLGEDGHEQLVVCLSDDAEQFARSIRSETVAAEVVGMNRYRVDVRGDLRTYRQLSEIVADFEPDAIIGHGSKAGLLARALGRRAGVPSVYALHSLSFVPRTQGRSAYVYRLLERLGARLGGQIVTVCEATRREVIEAGIAPPDRVTAILTGLTDDEIDAEHRVRRTSNSPAHRLHVGWAARLEPQKDPVTYVRAVALAVQSGSAASFQLLGDGSLLPVTLETITELGIGDRLSVDGWASDPHRVFADLDVVVSTSRWEGLPIALLEAMRCGAVPIATDVDGVAEAIRDGETGRLVDRGDSDAIASAILELERDPDQLLRLSRQAQDTVERDFRATEMAQAWNELLILLVTE